MIKDITPIRNGITDIWNAFMVDNAMFDDYDIPFCPTTATSCPSSLISWPEAKRFHRKALKDGNDNYHISAFIHFYVDDDKFDGSKSSIWLFPWKAIEIMRHFDGIITPDFSICQDFPEPIKVFAIYRMRAFGLWAGTIGIEVINNVRWGSTETWEYCFASIPKRSVVSVGPVASGLRSIKNRPLFVEGFSEMISRLKPTAIIVYGSPKYECFKQLEHQNIEVIRFESETSQAYARKEALDEQTV